MGKKYKAEQVPFEVHQLGIDQFVIPVDLLRAEGNAVTRVLYEPEMLTPIEQIAPDSESIGEYLDGAKLMSEAQYAEELTVVIDLPVGKGKTTGCYDAIAEYTHDPMTVILVVSPFRKLVDKDYKALQSERKLRVFSYNEIPDKKEQWGEILDKALQMQVHILTVNCLLGNPGDDAFEQNAQKSLYLDRLYEHCNSQGKKVFIFFDEMHEAVYNFAPQFLPNLYKWHDVVRKCFVSSATFTPAVYPVLKYIGLLTNKTFRILHTLRQKWSEERLSNLHLHILKDEYSAANLEPLYTIRAILEESVDKQVNILTGHKTLAKALLKPQDTNGGANPVYEVIQQFKFNPVTGDSDKPFRSDGNNIGTAFKTGVNIDNPNSVYVVVLPVTKQNSPDSIFNDGAPSVIQALARQRNGGEIHIFMYEPTHVIELQDDADQWKDEYSIAGWVHALDYKPLKERLNNNPMVETKPISYYRDQSRTLQFLYKQYSERYERNKVEIQALQQMEANGTARVGFQYPTFEEYLIRESANLMAKNFPQFGSDLSSYTLWAAMHGQFTNAELKTITYYCEDVVEIKFDSSDMMASILNHVKPEQREALKHCDLRTVRFIVQEELVPPKDSGLVYAYYLDGVRLPLEYLLTHPKYLRAILEFVANNHGLSTNANELKSQYFLHSIAASLMVNPDEELVLDIAYAELYQVMLDFIDFYEGVKVKVGDNYAIHKDADKQMPMEIADAVKRIAVVLQAEDAIIKYRAISFQQGISKVTGNALQASVYRELCKLFTNLTDKRGSVGGKKGKNAYYLIDGELAKVLPLSPVLMGM